MSSETEIHFHVRSRGAGCAGRVAYQRWQRLPPPVVRSLLARLVSCMHAVADICTQCGDGHNNEPGHGSLRIAWC